jgi:hypothetical protein
MQSIIQPHKRKKHMKTIAKFIYPALAGLALVLAAVTPTANGAPGDLFASVNGNGQEDERPGLQVPGGSIFQYTPDGLYNMFGPALSQPRGMAFDSDGNLFVATNVWITYPTVCLASILKITPGGVQLPFFSVTSSFFFAGVAIDGANNVFVTAGSISLAVTIYKFTPSGVQSIFATPPSVQSIGLAFDSLGDLYTAVNFATGPSQIWKYMPDGTSSVFATSSQLSELLDLAFDRFGNLFVSAVDKILKYTPDGTENTFATGLNPTAKGLAFDRGGNLFVAETIQTGPGDILKFTPGGIRTVFASGIGPGGNGGPEFLAFQPLTPRPRPSPHGRPIPRL